MEQNNFQDALSIVVEQMADELNGACHNLITLKVLADMRLLEKYARAILLNQNGLKPISSEVDAHILSLIDEMVASYDYSLLRSASLLANSDEHYKNWIALHSGLIGTQKSYNWEKEESLQDLAYDCRAVSIILYHVLKNIKEDQPDLSDFSKIFSSGLRLAGFANAALGYWLPKIALRLSTASGYVGKTLEKEQGIAFTAYLLTRYKKGTEKFMKQVEAGTGKKRTTILGYLKELENGPATGKSVDLDKK